MQKQLPLLFLLWITCFISWGQSPQVSSPFAVGTWAPHQQQLVNGCGTHITEQQLNTIENNPVFQQAYRDHLSNYANQATRSIDYIPIKAHIVRTSGGSGGLTLTQLNSAIATMNTYYINSSMQFFLCGSVNYIDDDNYYNFDSADEATLHGAEGVANLINIYFCNSIISNGKSLCGYAYTPGLFSPDIVLMKNSCATNGSTLTHELAHFFGLAHTHGTSNGVLTTELVDGSNCGTTGDPQLSSDNVSNCVYDGTAPSTGGINTDANGDLFAPDPNNIMSYAPKTCRTFLSPGQYARIRAGYATRNYFTCPSTSSQNTVYSIVNTATLPSCGSTEQCNSSWTSSTYYGREIQATASINGNQIIFVVSKCDGTAFNHGANYGVREATCVTNNTNIAGGSYTSGSTSFTITAPLPANFTSGVRTYYVMTNPAGSHYRTGGITVSANASQASAPNLEITDPITLNPSGSTLTQGDLRTVSVDVSNTGAAWSGSIHLKIISNTTNQILKTHAVSINANSTQTINFSNVSFNNPPGNYSLQLAYETIGTSNQIALQGNPVNYASRVIQIQSNGTNALLQPNFSIAGGSYFNSQSVVLFNPNPQGKIYYTEGATNAIPSPNATVGTEYTVPIQVTTDKVIKAVVVHNGQASNIRTETYTITSNNSVGAVTHTLSGIVKDASTLQPIAGALVNLSSNTGGLSTTADAYGAYSFTLSDGWTGFINAAKASYQTSSSINLGPIRGNTTRDITLNALPQTGDLTINILPNSVQNIGEWREQGGSNWYPSGYTLSNLSAGPIAIEFKNIGNNWTAPNNQTILLGNGASKAIDVQYTNGALGLDCSGCLNKLRVNTQPLEGASYVATYPKFSWEHELGKGISSYRLFVSKAATPSVIEFDQTISIPGSENWLSYQMTTNKLDHNETYRWKIVGLDANSNPIACFERTFSTYLSPDKDPNPTCNSPCTGRDIVPNTSTESYGTPLGNSNNVVIYKNGDCACPGGNSYRTYMGRPTQYPVNGSRNHYGWQCTEYVYRYYKQVYGLNIRPGHAKAYTNLIGNRRGIKAYRNGQTSMLPQLGDYVVYNYGTYGHVAIVDRVEPQGGNIYHVYLAQQNVGIRTSNHTNRLKVVRQESNGNFSLLNGTGRDASCVGWFRAKPSLTSPGSTTNFTTINTLSPDYTWEKHDGIKEYELFIVELDNSGCGTLHHQMTLTNNTVNNATIPPLKNNTKYKWRVLAYYHNGGKVASDAHYFETNASTWNRFSTWVLENNGGSSSVNLLTLGSVLSGAKVYTKIGTEIYEQGTTDLNGQFTASIGQTPSIDDSIRIEHTGYESISFPTSLLLQNTSSVGIPMFEQIGTQPMLPKVFVTNGNNVRNTNAVTFSVNTKNITGYQVFGEEGSSSLFFGANDTLITVPLLDTGLNIIGFEFYNTVDTIQFSYPVYYTPSVWSNSNYTVHISNPNQLKGKLYVDDYYLRDLNTSTNVLLPSGNHKISIHANGLLTQTWEVDSLTPIVVYTPQDRLPMITTQSINNSNNKGTYLGASVSTKSNGSNAYTITRAAADYSRLGVNVIGESIQVKKIASNTDSIDVLVYVDVNQLLDTAALYILKESSNGIHKNKFNAQIRLDTFSQKWSLLGLTEDSSRYSIAVRQAPIVKHPIMNGFSEKDTLLLPISYFFADPDSITQDLWCTIATYNTGALAVSLNNDTVRIYSVGGFTGTSTISLTAVHDDIALTEQFDFEVFPALNLGNDTTMCNGGSVVLEAGFNSGLLYEWSTGAFTPSITVVTSGTYRVTITNILTGTTEEDSIQVVINENPSNNIISANALTACEGQHITLSGIFGTKYQYQWFRNGWLIPNAISQYYPANNSGNYHLEIDVESCIYTSPSVSVNFISAPNSMVNVGTNPVCMGDTVALQAIQNSGWVYSWQKDGLPISGATTSSYKASVEGNYNVVITDSVCTSTSTIVPVDIKDYPQANLLILGDTTYCSSDSVLLASTTGLGYSYQWYQNSSLLLGKNASILSPNSSGHYYCVINNGACSTATNSVAITVLQEPTMALNHLSATQFCSGDDVVLSAVGSSGISYDWYKDGSLLSGFNSANYTASTTGIYQAKGTLNGCEGESNTIAVTAYPRASKGISIIGGSSLCQGQVKQIVVEGNSDYSYQWYHNNIPIINSDTSSIEVGTGGNYWAIITTNNGCIDTTQMATIIMAPNPPPSTPTIVQSGTTLIASPILSGILYQWYINGFASNTGAFINASATGNYTVVATNISGCAAVADTSISMTFPTAYIPTNSSSICTGDSLLLVAMSDSTYSYQWLHNGDTIIGATMASYWAKQSGNYRVMVGQNGFNKLSNIVSITANAAPSIAISSSGTTTLCEGQELTLISNTNAPFIQWYRNDTAIVGEVFTTYNANESAYYSAKARAINGCTTQSTKLLVSVYEYPTVHLSAVEKVTICEGDSFLIETTADSLYQYTWTNNTLTIPNANSNALWLRDAGNYKVYVDNHGCIDSSQWINLSLVALPKDTISIDGNTTFCTGDTIQLKAVSDSHYQYQWYQNGLLLSMENDSTLSVTDGSTYWAVIDNQSCKVISDTIDLSVYSLPIVELSHFDTIRICESEPLSIATLDLSNHTYQWYMNNTLLPNTDTAVYTIDSSGGYHVVVSNGHCSTTSDSVWVIIDTFPTADLNYSGTVYLCEGDSITLSSIAYANSYQWFKDGHLLTGDTLGTMMIDNEGIYHVMLAMGSCLLASEPVEILTTSIHQPAIHGMKDSVICSGDNAFLYTKYLPNTTYQWFLDGQTIQGGTNSGQSITGGGTYKVILNQNGCEDSVSITLNELIVNPQITLQTDTLWANYTSGQAYLWYHNGLLIDSTMVPWTTVTANGAYHLVVEDSTGCTGSSNILTVAMLDLNLIGGNDLEIVVAPNPTSGNFTIYLSNLKEQNIQIQFVDVLGRVIFSTKMEQVTSNTTLEYRREHMLAAGIYFLNVLREDQTTIGTQKVIIR